MLVQWDAGESVTGSLLSLAEAGGIGLLLSVAVLYFFLRHWPSTLMVTTAIPICFVITLGFMYFVGITLNVLTMMGLLLAIGMLVDNAVVVVESIYQERERLGGDPVLSSIIGTRHVAIALSAGTLCHCIVFVPNLFGEKNMISIYMGQIAITICVSLMASWLVAVSLIPMLSARMKTPPAVKNEKGVITRLQRRYARLLRWTLEHRGLSVLGILLIVAVSFVPLKMTKVNMFGGEDIGEIDVYYQWKGAYTKEQMSDEILKVEKYLDANREKFHIDQVFSRYREQGWAGTNIKLDTKDGEQVRKITEQLREGMPKSARATIGIGDQGGPGGDKQGKEDPGDAGGRLDADAQRAREGRGARAGAAQGIARRARGQRRPGQRTGRARGSRTCRVVRLQRQRRRNLRRPGLARRAAARVPSRRYRSAGVGALRGRRRLRHRGPGELHRACARRPQRAAAGDGGRAGASGRFADRTHQPPDHADDHREPSPTRSCSPMRARRSTRRSRASRSRPATAISFERPQFMSDDDAVQQMMFNLGIALADDLRGDGRGVRIAAVPLGDHERRAVLDLRRVLAVLDHRPPSSTSWPSSASWC
jgi:HAE1 family hydrophobic/amphiphilic exporter-1